MKREFTRLLENKITNALKTIGCVLIEGPKHSGKTFLAKKISNSQFYVQSQTKFYIQAENQFYVQDNKKILEGKSHNSKPKIIDELEILNGLKPRLIDEWQIAPQIWDEVRFRIDQSDDPAGLYILTGSSKINFSKVSHSGAGRILIIPTNTLTFAEICPEEDKVSLKDLFFNPENMDPNIFTEFGFEQTIQQLINGGWPYPLANNISSQNTIKSYLSALANKDEIAFEEFNLKSILLEPILISLARLNGTQIKQTAILNDLNVKLNVRTLIKYLDHIKNQYLIFNLSPWWKALNNSNSKTLIRSTSKTYWTDPSIGLYLLKIKNINQLYNDLNTLTIYFENQVIKDLVVYANALNGNLYFYRDSNGFEIDAIMELDDGKWAAFEIKLSEINFDQAAQNLLRFEKRILEQKIKQTPASFLMIISAQNYGYQREDGVYVIAHSCLGV